MVGSNRITAKVPALKSPILDGTIDMVLNFESMDWRAVYHFLITL